MKIRALLFCLFSAVLLIVFVGPGRAEEVPGQSETPAKWQKIPSKHSKSGLKEWRGKSLTVCGANQPTKYCYRMGGNMPPKDYCPYCENASLTLGPENSTVKVGTPVTFGVVPNGFTEFYSADVPWPKDAPLAAITIDFSNGAPQSAPLKNGVGTQFTTTFSAPGTYTVSAGAEMERFLKPNDWWTVYVCCAEKHVTITVTP
jgi:hypothetical protein